MAQQASRTWAGNTVQYCLAAKDVTPARSSVVGQFRAAIVLSTSQLVANPATPPLPTGASANPNTAFSVDLVVFLNPVEDGITAGSGYNGGTSLMYVESVPYYGGPNAIGGTWREPADY